MKRWSQWSLYARLTVVQIGLLSFVWLLVVGSTLQSIYGSGAGVIDTDLQLLAQTTARLVALDADAARAERIARELGEINSEVSAPPMPISEYAFQVWTADRRLLTRSTEAPRLRELPPGTLPEGRSSSEPGWVVFGAWSADRRVYAVSAQSADYYERIRDELARSLVTPFAALVVLLALVFWLTLRVLLAPLRRLAREMRSRSREDLSEVDDTAAFAELRPLLAALNDKLARIRTTMDSERRFFADAAHELRTPLAAIGAQAHVLAHESSSGRRMQALAAIESGISRSARVVSRLLTLGRLESAESGLVFGTHDLVAIAAGVVGAHRARATARGQALLLAGEVRCPALVDPEAIATAIENLVDNALRHTPDGTTIVVTVSRTAEGSAIQVADDGPGVAPADRERVFERFARLAKSEGSGSGLGLAIVRRIASLHGGSARATPPADGTGVVFELILPDARPALG